MYRCSQLEYTHFLSGQNRLRLKDENVFINLKYPFPFDFMSEVLTHDCVVYENEKKTDNRFNAKSLFVPLVWEKSHLLW